MTAAADPIAVALLVIGVFDALNVVSTVGGSIAGSFAGEPRSTIDIDIVVALETHHVSPLVTRLGHDFYVDEVALHRAVRERSHTNLIHHETQLKVDLFVAGGTPLDAQQLGRRIMVPLGGGRSLPVHPPEDILLQKLRWYRAGGETSDRQWRDVTAIVRVQGERLDAAYLRSQAPMLNVGDLLERVLSGNEPDPQARR